MNNFTTEDMIRFLYNELSPEETARLVAALEEDWTLKEKFDVLKSSMNSLDSLHFSPRKKSIDAILQYAEDTAPAERSLSTRE
jgi:hypothetical protein